MTCPDCGEPLHIGSWPFCKDGHTPGAQYVRQDEFIGGLTLENLGDRPVTVHSRSELQRELRARGLEECVRHVPVPGSDKSPHTTSWAAVDLEAGKALAERQATSRVRHHERVPDPSVVEAVRQHFEEFPDE